MSKQLPKKISTNLEVDNKYRFVIIKRPNGKITICRSTYIVSDDSISKDISKDMENINVTSTKNTNNYLNIDVDYQQYLIHNKDIKKKRSGDERKSKRLQGLNKTLL